MELLLLSLLAVVTHASQVVQHLDSVDVCPEECKCLPNYIVICNNKQLTYVPKVPSNVTHVDLSNNLVEFISSDDFKSFPLLEKLILGNNRIGTLDVFAFRGLDLLETLNLDRNLLTFLPRPLFNFNPVLTRLMLSSNILNVSKPLPFSESITYLDLSRCKLKYLPPKFLAGLPQLKTLILRHNSLESLSIQFFVSLPKLQKIYLHGNPWRCGGTMEELMLSKQDLIADHKKMHCVTSDGEQQVWSQGSWKPATTSSETSSKQTSQSVVVESTTAAAHADITGTSHSEVVESTTAAPRVDITGRKKKQLSNYRSSGNRSYCTLNIGIVTSLLFCLWFYVM